MLAALAAAAPARAELPVPALRARVNDTAGLIPAARERRLEDELARFEAETSHQIAVLTVASLEGEPIESFSLRVVEDWQLGQAGADNGLLILVASQDRQARVEVGYGLEGVVPDVIAKRILEDVMFGHFRAGDFAAGIEAGARAAMAAARGELIPPELRRRQAWRRPGSRGGPPIGELCFAAILGSFLWSPFRGGRLRWLGALLGGLVSGGLVWLLVRSLGWAAAGVALGALLGWLGPGVGSGGRRRGRYLGAGWGGGLGSGGFGGGFGGGGGGFGGGGASGSW